MGDVYVVTAFDQDAGEEIVGVFDNEIDAEHAVHQVPEPWAVGYQTIRMGVVRALPELARG